MKLYVKNLPFTTTAAELHKTFEPYGKVSVEINFHRDSKRSKGSAFLTFESDEMAEKAQKEKHGELLGGRVMKVSKYDPNAHKQRQSRRRANAAQRTDGNDICFGYPVSQQIYVGGIGELDEANVHAIFVPFGDIVQVDIMRNKRTGAPKGYGFVIFRDQMAAKASLEMNGAEIAGVTLKVSLARMKRRYPKYAPFHDPMGPDNNPSFNMWPSHSLGPPLPIHNPYVPFPAEADFPSQEPGSHIAPMPGGASQGAYPMGRTITPPPPSELSDQLPPPPMSRPPQVPFMFPMTGPGIPPPHTTAGYSGSPHDVPGGLIAGFGNLNLGPPMGFYNEFADEVQRTSLQNERRQSQQQR